MKYVEANGCCLNIDEKMRLSFAVEELKLDLNLTDPVYLVAKVTGIIKDYYCCYAKSNGAWNMYWSSSGTWAFSLMPAAPTEPGVV
jgi:hypothetical protein